MFFGVMPAEEKAKTRMKLVCAGADERVVGLHVAGMGADEMLQGFGVALRVR
jgi:glutathione reductase (NADPH)